MFPKDIAYTAAINLSSLLNSSPWNISKWVAGIEKMWTWFFLCSQLVGKFSRQEPRNQWEDCGNYSHRYHWWELLLEHAQVHHIIVLIVLFSFSVQLSSIWDLPKVCAFGVELRKNFAKTNSRSFFSLCFLPGIFLALDLISKSLIHLSWLLCTFAICHFPGSILCLGDCPPNETESIFLNSLQKRIES